MVKNLLANAGDPASNPGSGRFPIGRNGNPLEYSCLGNPTDRAAWQAAVHGVAKSQTGLSDSTTFTLQHTQRQLYMCMCLCICVCVSFFSQCCCCCCQVASVVSDSVQPHRWQPTRLPHPWDSPGKNTGVGCHFLLHGIFLTQGWNLHLLHSRQILYHCTQA